MDFFKNALGYAFMLFMVWGMVSVFVFIIMFGVKALFAKHSEPDESNKNLLRDTFLISGFIALFVILGIMWEYINRGGNWK